MVNELEDFIMKSRKLGKYKVQIPANNKPNISYTDKEKREMEHIKSMRIIEKAFNQRIFPDTLYIVGIINMVFIIITIIFSLIYLGTK